MSRRLALLDRFLTLLVGLALVAGGLALVDWQAGLVLPWPDSLDLSAMRDVVDAQWFAWAAAGATVLLGLLAVWWLLAHVPRPAGTQVRTAAGDRTGSVKVDLSSVADAAAARFAQQTPVLDASGVCRSTRGGDLVEIKARVDVRADADIVHAAAARTRAEVAKATDRAAPELRILLEAPRRLPLTSSGSPQRVH